MVRCRVVVVARQHVPRNIEEQNSFLSHITFFSFVCPAAPLRRITSFT